MRFIFSLGVSLLRLAVAILMHNVESPTKFKSSFYILVSRCSVYSVRHRTAKSNKNTIPEAIIK